MPQDSPVLCYVNVWRARDGTLETEAFVVRDQALEEIGAGYPNVTYIGTATLPKFGDQAAFEDLSEEAHHQAMEATEDWLGEQRERRALQGKLL